MEKTVKHRFLDSVVFTGLLIPLGFFLVRDSIAVLTGIVFESTGGKESFLYQINDDIARFIIAGLLILIMPLFFRENCSFGFKGGKLALGFCLALPELAVPLWNLLQIKIYDAPLVTGASAVAAAIIHGIAPGVSEEIFCRGFVVSNLMRIWKDKPNRVLRCVLFSGLSFGLLHASNVIATGDVTAALVQVIYTAAIGMAYGAVFLRSRNIWGVIILHSLTDISAFIAVFETEATKMDVVFCIFGSLLFIALALFLVRPAKHTEIDVLWENGWSFGEENEKKCTGIKAAVILSVVLVITFIASLGISVYQSKMGYDVPIFSSFEKKLDKDIQYTVSDDGKELTVSLPFVDGEKYEVTNSASESFILKESGANGNVYVFVFENKDSSAEKAMLSFELKVKNMPAVIHSYTMTVSFSENGSISAVRG